MNINLIIFFSICIKLFISVLSAEVVIYPVSKVIFEYGNYHSSLPDLKLLNKAYYSPKENGKEFPVSTLTSGLSKPINISDEGIFRLGELGIHFLKDQGFEGVVALPHPDLIDPVSGEDLRVKGDNRLVIQLWVSVLNKVEIDLVGLRAKEKTRVERNIQKQVESLGYENKPIRASFFEEMNHQARHSSRSTKVILTATENPGRVNALVRSSRRKSENFSLSSSNSGSPTTGRWLFSAEAKTNQLSGNDDLISLGYTVSNTGERQSFKGSYYLPFLPREKLGIGLGLGYSSYDASTFAVTTLDFEGENLYGDISIHANSVSLTGDRLNIEAELGLKIENVKSFSTLTNRVDVSMLTPRISLSLNFAGDNRIARTSLSLLGNILTINESDLLSLGGIDVNDRYGRILLAHSETIFLGKMFAPSRKYLSKHIVSLNLQTSLVLSNDRHLPQHQFITGGTGSVRWISRVSCCRRLGNVWIFGISFALSYSG